MKSTTQFPYVSPTLPGLVFDLVQSTDQEVEQVSEFLIEHFFPVVPIGKVFDIDMDVEVRPWVSGFVRRILQSGLCIVTRDVDNDFRLVAIRMNEIEHIDDDPCSCPIPEVDKDLHPKMFITMDVLAQLGQDFNVFQTYQVNQVFSLVLMAVDKRYGHRGIASKLVELTLELAKSKDISVLKVTAVNEYAYKALAKFGFQVVQVLPLESYQFNGNYPFRDLKIHSIGRLLVKHCQ